MGAVWFIIDTWNFVVKKAGHVFIELGENRDQVVQLSDVHMRILNTGRGFQKLTSKCRDHTEVPEPPNFSFTFPALESEWSPVFTFPG